MLYEEIINSKYAFLFKAVEKFNPSMFHPGKLSITSFSDLDIFPLNEIKCGAFTDCVPELNMTPCGKGIIIRSKIGYAAALQIEEDFAVGCFMLSNFINGMLYDAFKFKKTPFDKFKTIRFSRVGKKNVFFTEIEDGVGYELQLYIEFEQGVE